MVCDKQLFAPVPLRARAGLFGEWQPEYAKHGIATFPVRDKRPAVKNYLRMGLAASRELATKRGDAEAFGFACGKHSRITVIDVDSPDEGLLREVENRFGPTPFIVRSGRGNHQAWYRHNGEGRKIRPDRNVPIDILGAGFVVAPPSRVSWGAYSLIRGSLEDLAALPPLQPQDVPVAAPDAVRSRATLIPKGERNNTLWRLCMEHAPDCARLNELMEFAMQANNERAYVPLSADEVVKVVASAWEKEVKGENFFGGRKGLVIPNEQVDALLLPFPDAFVLLMLLKRHNWGRPFFCANAMAKTMPNGGWPEKRFAAARRKLEEIGEILILRPASRHNGPAMYQFKGRQI